MSNNEIIIELLEEILLWTKYDYAETKRKMLVHLNTDEKKIAYQLSDGEKSTRYISKKAGVHFSTIADWWKSWFKLELMEQTEKYSGSRYKKLASLLIMGIPVPEVSMEEEDE